MRVGLLGYGKMGRGIFSLLADSPLEATVLLRDPAKAEDGNKKLERRLKRAAANGLFPEAELSQRLTAYRFTTDWNELANCELLIESIAEDYDLKRETLQRLESIVAPSAIITTNSSSFSPTELGRSLQRPEQFCGFHFFHPIQLTSIVEIIVGEQTSPQVVEALREASLTMHRTPIVVKDYAGSAINVILTGLTCESLYILEQGLATPTQIDGIAAKFGRLGPCEAVDTIGVKFFTEVLERTLDKFPFRLAVPELLRKLIRDERDGKYSGRGLYVYRDDRPYDDDAEYYFNPAQTHSPTVTSGDESALLERLLIQIYYYILFLSEMGLGTIDDFSYGIQDLIGLRESPVEKMREIGGEQLRDTCRRLQSVFGDRYSPKPVSKSLAELSHNSATVETSEVAS